MSYSPFNFCPQGSPAVHSDARTSRTGHRLVGLVVAVLLVAVLFVLVLPERAAGQSDPSPFPDWTPPLEARVGLTTTASTSDRAPFWLVANEFGLQDRSGETVLARAALTLPPTPGRTVDVAAGLDLAARGAETSALYVHQAYGRLIAGPFRLTAGRVEYVQGIVDTTLTLGSSTWSANATPVPAVRIETTEYVGVPFTRGFLSARGTFAHGWFEDDRFVRDAFLHEKQFYLRVLPHRWPIQFHGGVIHNVMWGGTHPQFGALPRDASAFWSVIRGEELDADLGAENDESGIGNTVAAYDFAITTQGFGWRGRIYREFYIETADGARILRNEWDGIWGLNVIRKSEEPRLVERLLYEHLRYVRQNAVYPGEDISNEGRRGMRGREDYFNNFLYQGGWVYEGRTLTQPLILTNDDARRLAFPEGDGTVSNNIIVAHHVGVSGHVTPGWTYRTLLTYSRNHGTVFNQQPRLDQFSGRVEVQGPLLPEYGVDVRAALAVDAGEVYDERAGLLLGLTWTPSFP